MRPSRAVWLAAALLTAAACGGDRATAPGGTTTPPDTGVAQLPDADVSDVPAHDPGSTLSPDWKLGPFAEIYVRGYEDANGDGLGDLRGLTAQLDYLKSLGVTGIWLMPVTASQDHDHGYTVVDYRNVESQYGSLADLDALVAQAHARGIGVILDYVINHSGSQNPLFQNANASAAAPRRQWYVWSDGHPAGWSVFGSDPWRAGKIGYYYGAFSDQMPDFDFRNAAVLAYHQANLRFWLNRGVDGFRFDAVGNLVENGPNAWLTQPEDYTVMGEMRAVVDGYANRFLVCESPDDPLGFASPSACGRAFAFGHNHDIMNAVHGDAAAVQKVATYFGAAPLTMATLLASHDSYAGARVWDQVGGDPALYRLAAATYLLQPGVPFVYYGEEIGMAGGIGLTGDWSLRTPMSWDGSGTAGFTTGTPFRALSANHATNNVQAEAGDATSLLSFYRALIALRHARPSLAQGTYERAAANGLTMRFLRVAASETTLVALNDGSADARVTFDGLAAGTAVRGLFPASAAGGTASGAGTFTAALPAHAFVVLGVGH